MDGGVSFQDHGERNTSNTGVYLRRDTRTAAMLVLCRHRADDSQNRSEHEREPLDV